ncbi:SpoIIIAH-like family protein [Amphibacillus sp. Q70]|uniref:SpoIIIAH-like family protein n=1 Tax=Amphibacillus sp. Q70 TaxID=3453416 RepID=UPI003F85310C
MLKKQTVWLLTLLSLMIVLSVFYMNSPNGDDFSFIFQEETDGETELTSEDLADIDNDLMISSEVDDFDNSEGDDQEQSDISSVSSDEELFTVIRMELAQSRSSQIEQLESVVASNAATSEEKNDAYEEMQKIDQLSTKELIVEESLKTEYGYSDVLVRTMDDNIIVTIKTDSLSDKEANQIMRTVYDEFGAMQVQVKFQPSNT